MTSTATRRRLDPVTLEVVRNALPAISDEMALALQSASYNMMIYEVRDFCCALLGINGELLSQNVGGVSHFVADLGVIIEDAVQRYGVDGFEEGDVLLTNHQAVAGQHLNNMVVYTPIFVDHRLVGFAMSRAHWIDVGGLSTGFGGGAAIADPWMEGLQIDQMKIHRAGVPDESLMRMLETNVRYPDAALGDLRAQIGSCRVGSSRFVELYEKYGAGVVEASIARIFQDTETRCRTVVAAVPDGVYEATSFLDDDGLERDVPLEIGVKVIVQGSDMVIDLSGCAGQRRAAVNSRTYAGARVAYKFLTGGEDPVNEGSFRALQVVIPEGNIMMARFPAPMANWSRVLPTVVDTVFAALAPAMKDTIPAAHLGYLGSPLTFFGTNPETGDSFVVQSLEGGGWGGRPGEDGPSASLSVCQGDVRNAPIESIELRCPVVIEQRALRRDSGGAGENRGGLGVEVIVRNLVDGHWSLVRRGRTDCPPWGLWGGKPGIPGEPAFASGPGGEPTAVDEVRQWAPAGSRAVVRTAGGGGWGDPRRRSPDRVLADVRDGAVSVEAAAREYGVVIDPDHLVVDAAATAVRRPART